MADEKPPLRNAELPIGLLTTPNDLAEKMLGPQNEASRTHFPRRKNVLHEEDWRADFRWD
jgi:hypothetical protein